MDLESEGFVDVEKILFRTGILCNVLEHLYRESTIYTILMTNFHAKTFLTFQCSAMNDDVFSF